MGLRAIGGVALRDDGGRARGRRYVLLLEADVAVPRSEGPDDLVHLEPAANLKRRPDELGKKEMSGKANPALFVPDEAREGWLVEVSGLEAFWEAVVDKGAQPDRSG